MRIWTWALALVSVLAVSFGACTGSKNTSDPNGTCSAASQCGTACCPSGQTCLAPGQCGQATACSASSQCDPDRFCLAGFCVRSNAQCSYHPQPGPFAPRIAWKWTGSATLPQYADVLMTPVVIPLTKDNGDVYTPPAVVFNSIENTIGAGPEVPGVMRAVSGRDGTEIWTSDPAHLVNGLAGIAAGDLFGDGGVEFVTARFSNFTPSEEGLIAFDSQGHFLWEVKGIHVQWGAPTIARLSSAKEASVVFGATIIDAHGNLVCKGAYGQGSNFLGPISAIADVDLDGVPEIVTGNAIYDASCQPKPGWPNGQSDGLVAVADFTGDAHPEIVVVSNNTVRLQDWMGHVIWGPVALPENCVNGVVPLSGEPCTLGGGGGAPTVADFDGDGKPEIGVAGNSTYTVLKPFAANPILWTKNTQDTSKVTGSSVFDFEHDGKAEVVYSDECDTRIFDGTNGDILFQAPNPSCTTQENPVIADVDRDGRAEIIVATNSVCGNTKCEWGSHFNSGYHGITVFKDLRDHWVSTRSVWNEHAYHVTNVNDDGSLPWPEANNWENGGLNNYRMNVIGDANFAAPDLAIDGTRGDVGFDASACPSGVRITAKVWNRGAVLVTAGVPVAFYQDKVGGKLLAVGKTQGAILPGGEEQVSATISPAPSAGIVVAVSVNDDGTGQGVVGECDTSNNVAYVSGVRCMPLGM